MSGAARIGWARHPEYDAWLRANVPGRSGAEVREGFEREFGLPLSDCVLGNRKSALGLRSGRPSGRFEPGHVPANKGRTWDEQGIPEEVQGRMRRGQFKRGNLPWTTREIGEERVTKDGYIEVHVAQRRRERANDQWVMKHRLVWEEANGRELAPDEAVMFADGDVRNLDPGNLVAVTRAERGVINALHLTYRDRATLESAISIARLRMGIARAETRPRECAACGRTFAPRFARQRRCDACIAAKRKGARHGRP